MPEAKPLSEAEIADKISRWLRQPEAQLFMERVEDRHRRALSGLKNSYDLLNLGRSQGEMTVLDWILHLRREEGD